MPSECAKQYDAVKDATIMVFRSFENSPVEYLGTDTKEKSILIWMEILSVPSLIEFSDETVADVMRKGRTSLILFSDDKEASYQNVFKEAAKLYQGHILYATCTSGEDKDSV